MLNMFRAMITPIFQSTRLCVTARCCWTVTGNIVGALYRKL